MPSAPVKQANGLYAIYSSVVDDFHAWNLTRDEALNWFLLPRRSEGYPGGVEGMRKDILEGLDNLDKTGMAWNWMIGDFQRCVSWTMFITSGQSARIAQMREAGAITEDEWRGAIAWANAAWEEQAPEDKLSGYPLTYTPAPLASRSEQ